jgi:phage terminase large subunit GpA-like protein
MSASPTPLDPRVVAVYEQAALEALMPPPALSLCDWAEQNFVLSREDSATVGRYSSAIAPFQRGPLDAITTKGVRRVVLWTAAQIMKTLVLKIALAYFIKEDPSPVLWMTKTLDLAKRVSRQRLAPMFRDIPALAGLLGEGARQTGNAMLEKSFSSGAVLFVVGANSPASLSSMPIRVLLSDEIDGYPPSAGSEGDPISLARKRLTTFWNALEILASTCTEEGFSNIIREYEETDRRKYWVPCPQCGEFQVLKWGRLKFPTDGTPLTNDNVVYACEHNGCALSEFDKHKMLAGGEWRAERPEITKIVGFWISEMYSPFTTWVRLAEQFLETQRHRENPELLKAFITLSLAEPWKQKRYDFQADDLLARRELYSSPMPDGVTVLTCGVDVQEEPKRIELEVVGWGKGQESWSIDRLRFDGDVTSLKGREGPGGVYSKSAWEQLEEFLTSTRWLHARGGRLDIACTFIDSGYQAQTVYQFTKHMQKQGLRVFASKGLPGFKSPPLREWNRNNKPKVKLYPVGVDVLKKLVYDRLALASPGAGYCHFSKGQSAVQPDRTINTKAYFEELTAEHLKPQKVNGFTQLVWVKPEGKANESLDCRVYATAALLALSKDTDGMLEGLRAQLLERSKALRVKATPENQMDLLAGVDSSLGDEEVQTSAGESSVVSRQSSGEAPAAPVVPAAAIS